MNLDEFKTMITSFLKNVEITEETDTEIKYSYRERTFVINKAIVSSLFIDLEMYKSNHETDFYNDNEYEILVRFDAPININIREQENMIKTDEVNKIKYEISPASNIYLLNFLRLFNSEYNKNYRRRFFILNRQEDKEYDVFELLNKLFRIWTIKIKSETKKKREELENFSYAFIYNLGINLDLAIYPLRYIDEFVSKVQIRIRRSSFNEIEAPKRVYNNDLVLFYQRAIISESLDNQYLSFYHILEHFFDEVYNEDLRSAIKKELSQGTFSHKRNKDIEKLIDLIKKKLKYKNEAFLIQENEALLLTLKKYITDINEIKQQLIDYDPNLIEYYKTNEVVFSKGNKVNFDIDNSDEIYKNLSSRIYSTRNSIVHSKETETDKNKYLPFKDDRHLINENILLRLIAEKVLFESSKEI